MKQRKVCVRVFWIKTLLSVAETVFDGALVVPGTTLPQEEALEGEFELFVQQHETAPSVSIIFKDVSG